MAASNIPVSVLIGTSYIPASFLNRSKRWKKSISTYLIFHITLLEGRKWCSDTTAKCTIYHRKYTHTKSFLLGLNYPSHRSQSLVGRLLLPLQNMFILSRSLWHVIFPGAAPRVLLKHGYISRHAITVMGLILLGLHSSQLLQEGKKKKKPILVQISFHSGTDFSGFPNCKLSTY